MKIKNKFIFISNAYKTITKDLIIAAIFAAIVSLITALADNILLELRSLEFIVFITMIVVSALITFQLIRSIKYSWALFPSLAFFILSFILLSLAFNNHINSGWTSDSNLKKQFIVFVKNERYGGNLTNEVYRRLTTALPSYFISNNEPIEVIVLKNAFTGSLSNTILGRRLRASDNLLGFIEISPNSASDILIDSTVPSRNDFTRSIFNSVRVNQNIDSYSDNTSVDPSYAFDGQIGNMTFKLGLNHKKSDIHWGYDSMGFNFESGFGFSNNDSLVDTMSIDSSFYPPSVISSSFQELSDSVLLLMIGISGQVYHRYGNQTAICKTASNLKDRISGRNITNNAENLLPAEFSSLCYSELSLATIEALGLPIKEKHDKEKKAAIADLLGADEPSVSSYGSLDPFTKSTLVQIRNECGIGTEVETANALNVVQCMANVYLNNTDEFQADEILVQGYFDSINRKQMRAIGEFEIESYTNELNLRKMFDLEDELCTNVERGLLDLDNLLASLASNQIELYLDSIVEKIEASESLQNCNEINVFNLNLKKVYLDKTQSERTEFIDKLKQLLATYAGTGDNDKSIYENLIDILNVFRFLFFEEGNTSYTDLIDSILSIGQAKLQNMLDNDISSLMAITTEHAPNIHTSNLLKFYDSQMVSIDLSKTIDDNAAVNMAYIMQMYVGLFNVSDSKNIQLKWIKQVLADKFEFAKLDPAAINELENNFQTNDLHSNFLNFITIHHLRKFPLADHTASLLQAVMKDKSFSLLDLPSWKHHLLVRYLLNGDSGSAKNTINELIEEIQTDATSSNYIYYYNLITQLYLADGISVCNQSRLKSDSLVAHHLLTNIDSELWLASTSESNETGQIGSVRNISQNLENYLNRYYSNENQTNEEKNLDVVDYFEENCL